MKNILLFHYYLAILPWRFIHIRSILISIVKKLLCMQLPYISVYKFLIYLFLSPCQITRNVRKMQHKQYILLFRNLP